jgi:RND family efflux transporter MFP subunit
MASITRSQAQPVQAPGTGDLHARRAASDVYELTPSFPSEELDVRRNVPAPRGSRLRKLRWLLPLVPLTLASTVVYRGVFRSVTVPVAQARQRTLREEINGPGTLQSRTAVSVGSRIIGTVTEMEVDVGDRVKRGQLLAVLDDTVLEPRANAVLASAGAARLRVGRARATRAKANATLELARATFRRDEALHRQGAIADAQYDDSVARLQQAEAAVEEADLDIRALEEEAASMRREWGASRADAALTRVMSPLDGLVVQRVIEPGSPVVPGSPLFQLVDDKKLWVAVMLDESLARRVHVGSPAEVRLRSGAEVAGSIARVTLVADVVTRELEVDVSVDLSNQAFAINEEADVTIFGAEKTGIAVPAQALLLRPGDGPSVRGVLAARDGRARFVPVTEMLAAGRQALVRGLNDGELVLLEPSTMRLDRRVEPLQAAR